MTEDNKKTVDKKASPTPQKPTQSRTVVFEQKTKQQESSLVKSINRVILPLVAVREGIMFPYTEVVLNFGRKRSVAAIRKAELNQNQVVLVAQKNKSLDDPQAKDLYTIGTLSTIERTLTTTNQINALVQGVKRVKIVKIVDDPEYMMAEVEELEDIPGEKSKTHALSKHLMKTFHQSVNLGKAVEFLNFMKLMSGVHAGELADQIASTLKSPTSKKQKILEELHVEKRLEIVITELAKELHEYQIDRDIISQTQKSFDKHMKESVLRERMRTIKKELGELDEEEEELSTLEEQLKHAKLPKKIAEKAKRELVRLERMSINNPEAGYLRTWLETVFELPWNKRSRGILSLKRAGKILNKNHYGLKEVKERILEHLAVMQLKSKRKEAKNRKVPTILCFVGAPGVGKTSIGKSIAEAMGREFVKVSLGGIRDEAEIRGHRRTYVGAMPGRIVNGMKDAGTKNPVFMLDEIDKIGNDFRGDPSAALLEALDPEQNHEFSDHYLEVPYDLSEVLFITTANTLDTIPPALRDRLEIIEYSGYTEDEKFHIVKKHLMKKVMDRNGVEKSQLILSDDTIHTIIRRYTREAGVRSLERQIGKLIRKIARKIAEGETYPSTIKPVKLQDYLGPYRFTHTFTEENDEVGLATGLAWTSVGGDVLFIEVAITPGKGRVQLTGKLGDVMKESAQTALTYVRSKAKQLGISQKEIEKSDVHVHVPEGAVPKDGPSAGITMTTAIVSAFTKQPVKRDVAMTGEVTLRGRVLEIGGLKEKLIAAHRAGSKIAILPKDNEKDLVDVPDSVKKDITFHFVSHVDEVLKIALRKK